MCHAQTQGKSLTSLDSSKSSPITCHPLDTLITRGVSLVLKGHGQPGAVTSLKDIPGFPTRICPLPIATQQELEPWDPLPQPYWSVTWLVLVIQIPNSWDPQPCHTALPCTSPSPSSHIFCVLYFGEVPWALGMYWMQLANSREMQTFKHICFNWEFPRSL